MWAIRAHPRCQSGQLHIPEAARDLAKCELEVGKLGRGMWAQARHGSGDAILQLNDATAYHPCSVTVGIETAGALGMCVEEEGATAMTKPREPSPTVAFVDDYCAHYRAVFPNVRQVEQFTRLELGLVAETKRKSLPRLAQTAKADPH